MSMKVSLLNKKSKSLLSADCLSKKKEKFFIWLQKGLLGNFPFDALLIKTIFFRLYLKKERANSKNVVKVWLWHLWWKEES